MLLLLPGSSHNRALIPYVVEKEEGEERGKGTGREGRGQEKGKGRRRSVYSELKVIL